MRNPTHKRFQISAVRLMAPALVLLCLPHFARAQQKTFTWVVMATPRENPWQPPENVESLLIDAEGNVIKRKNGWWFTLKKTDGLTQQRLDFSVPLVHSTRERCRHCELPPANCPMLQVKARASNNVTQYRYAHNTMLAGLDQDTLSLTLLAQIDNSIWLREQRVGKTCAGVPKRNESLVEWKLASTPRHAHLQSWWQATQAEHRSALNAAYRKHFQPNRPHAATDKKDAVLNSATLLGVLPAWDLQAHITWHAALKVGPARALNNEVPNQDWIATVDALNIPSDVAWQNPSLSRQTLQTIQRELLRAKRQIVGISTYQGDVPAHSKRRR